MTTIDYSKYEGHTPQPWLPCDDGDSWNILAEVVDGPGHGTFAIAEISGPSFLTYCGGKPSANAALIADAPRILARCKALEGTREVLERVLARLEIERREVGPDGVFPCGAMLDDIRDALAANQEQA